MAMDAGWRGCEMSGTARCGWDLGAGGHTGDDVGIVVRLLFLHGVAVWPVDWAPVDRLVELGQTHAPSGGVARRC